MADMNSSSLEPLQTKRGERTTLRSSPLERRTAEHADPRPGLSGAFAL
jgi:hypothetical protein